MLLLEQQRDNISFGTTPVCRGVMSRSSVICLLFALCVVLSAAKPGLLVVLYSYPTENGGAVWTAVKNAKINNPGLPMMAIANPESGPGSSQDQTYVEAIDSLAALDITVLCYVDTDYATIVASTVKSNMDKYKQWYGNCSGFFLDQMKNEAGSEDYYTDLTAYAVSIGMGYTMGNPGTASIQSYINTVNNSVIYEHHPIPSPEVLNLGYPIERCSLIAYDVPASAVNQTYINQVSQYVQWIWLTDDAEPNPYDSNPTYFTTLVSYIVNVGSMPPVEPPSGSANVIDTPLGLIVLVAAIIALLI